MLSRANNSGNSSAKTPLYGGLVQLWVPPTPTPRSPSPTEGEALQVPTITRRSFPCTCDMCPRVASQTPSISDANQPNFEILAPYASTAIKNEEQDGFGMFYEEIVRVMLKRKVEKMREGSNENEPARIAPKSSPSTPSEDDEVLGTTRLLFPCDCKICRRASSQGLSAPSDSQSSIGVLAPPGSSSSVTGEEPEDRVMLYEEHDDVYVRMPLKRKFEAVGERSEEDGPPRVAPRYLSLSRRSLSTRNANNSSLFEVENGVIILPPIVDAWTDESNIGNTKLFKWPMGDKSLRATYSHLVSAQRGTGDHHHTATPHSAYDRDVYLDRPVVPATLPQPRAPRLWVSSTARGEEGVVFESSMALPPAALTTFLPGPTAYLEDDWWSITSYGGSIQPWSPVAVRVVPRAVWTNTSGTSIRRPQRPLPPQSLPFVPSTTIF